MRDPINVGMLKIDGNRLKEMGERPGPRMGWALHALLEEVLEDPKLNTAEDLETKATELLKLSDEHLRKLGEAGKDAKDDAEGEEIKKIRKDYNVK